MIGNAWVKVPQTVGGKDDGIILPAMVPYQNFVEKLFKKEDFRHMVDHARGGVCEEAGELSSALKKHVVYGIPLDKIQKDGQTLEQNIIEELGDLFFFTQAVMNLFGLTAQEILQHNADKLAKRYAGLTYTAQEAQDRADKTEGN